MLEIKKWTMVNLESTRTHTWWEMPSKPNGIWVNVTMKICEEWLTRWVCVPWGLYHVCDCANLCWSAECQNEVIAPCGVNRKLATHDNEDPIVLHPLTHERNSRHRWGQEDHRGRKAQVSRLSVSMFVFSVYNAISNIFLIAACINVHLSMKREHRMTYAMYPRLGRGLGRYL